jgi:hypothetical protein
MPSESGAHARRPSAEAPVTEPKQMWQVVGSMLTWYAPPRELGLPSIVSKSIMNTLCRARRARRSSEPSKSRSRAASSRSMEKEPASNTWVRIAERLWAIVPMPTHWI